MKEQLKRFISDEAMSAAVYGVIRRTFLKRRKLDDVQMLAAERLALFMLEDAWNELKKFGSDETEKKDEGNPGL